MNKKYFDEKREMIKEIFNDNRTVKCLPCEVKLQIDEELIEDGDLFVTDEGNFIYLGFQFEDFREEDLVKHICIAEELHDLFGKKVCIYIICSSNVNVYVKECELPSRADFAIKLAKDPRDYAQLSLSHIKRKIKNENPLDDEDIAVLSKLPCVCNKKDRGYYWLEYLKIINKNHY